MMFMRAGMICTKDKVVKNVFTYTQKNNQTHKKHKNKKAKQKFHQHFLTWIISLSVFFPERSNAVQSLQGMESEFT